jgi:ketosteroid isomerase-like protein
MSPHYLRRNRRGPARPSTIVGESSTTEREIAMSDLIERYLACWNETDAAARRSLVEQTFADEATYTDPLADVRGHDQIEATIAAVQQQFPRFVFTAGRAADQHHRQARFGWGLGPDGAEPLVEGFDVVVLDDDGRITAVLGFLDKVPSA